MFDFKRLNFDSFQKLRNSEQWGLIRRSDIRQPSLLSRGKELELCPMVAFDKNTGDSGFLSNLGSI